MKATSSSGQLTTDPYEEYPRLKGRKNKTGQSRVIRGPFEEMSARIQMLERPHRLLSEDRPRVNINSSSVKLISASPCSLNGHVTLFCISVSRAVLYITVA